jgi:hypothetical protein
VAPGTEVLVNGVGVSVGGVPAGAGSVATVGRGEASSVGKGVNVETGCVGPVWIAAGLAPVLTGWVVMVES